MKRKGINPLEQHVEKIVVGVFLIAAGGVFAMQIVKPSTVAVEKDKTSPQRAYERVSTRAEEVSARLRADRLPDGLPEAPTNVAAELSARLSAPVLPTNTLAGATGRPNSGLQGGDAPGGGDGLPVYALLQPPSTGVPVAEEHRATIDPLVVAAAPELSKHLPPSQPYDVRVVSVAASFPTNVLVQRLGTDPDGSGPAQAPPRFWWLNSMAVLDVRLERQERTSDGTFGETTLVPVMPAQYTLREQLGGRPADLGQALREARTRMADIAQPRFYATIAGPDWAPPRTAAAGEAPAAPVVDKAAEIARKKRSLEQLDAQIKRQKESLDRPLPMRTPVPGSGGPAGGGGGGFGGMASAQPSGGSTGGTTQTTAEDRRKEALRASIARLEQERDTLAAEIAALEAPAGDQAPAAPADIAAAPVRALESGEPFTVWAHDLTAAPGKTYRYRMSVSITNPLYGNERSMAPESRELAGRPAVVSDPSAWSEPVTVSPDAVVFFTSARGEGLGGSESGASATAEVYRFYYGYWRGKSTTLRPGDALVASVDVPEMPLFEIAAGANEGAKVVGQAAGPTKVEAGIPGGFVVDVLSTPAEGPGGREQVWQVVYRDGSGRLVVTSPGGAADAQRRAVEASEAAGKSQTVREPGVKPVVGAGSGGGSQAVSGGVGAVGG
ncbi:MAG: hypothetical protein AB7G17_08115 [Phycisphaerales bacterium]